MRALVKSRAEPGIWMEDVPRPSIGPNDVLIRVHHTSICGTDLHIVNWDAWAQRTIKVPLVVGHEVEGLSAGQRVAVEGHVTCGHCRNCRAGRRHLCRNTKGIGVNRPGAFAEFVSVPAVNVYVLPPGMPDEIGSCLDPLGNAVHSALSFELAGEDVLITGAGPIGVMSAAVSKMVGARYIVVTDSNAYRLNLARRMGATLAVDYRTTSLDQVMKELGMLEGFDIGLEMSGSPAALRLMIEVMNHGGGMALLGIPPGETAVDWSPIIFKGLRIKGIYGREMYDTWYKMIAMLQSGLDVSPVLTHRFPVASFEAGFAAMNEGRSGKVLLSWA